jgi:hypothetical protein
MNLALLTWGFLLHDPAFAPEEPKAYYPKDKISAKTLTKITQIGPGDPYPYQGNLNPIKLFY